MAATYDERMTSVIERVYVEIEKGTPPNPALLSKIENLRASFADIGGDWEDAPENLQADFDESDDHFSLAADEYVKVCDLLEEALVGRDDELADEAERSLGKAQVLLTSADEESKERFARWTAPSP